MEMDERKSEPMCPIVDIDGFIADGKQFDLDITLANDHRDVIYGIVRDCFKEPVSDAVVKLVEIEYKCGKNLAGSQTAFFGLSNKIGSAVASAVVAFVLSVGKFNAKVERKRIMKE